MPRSARPPSSGQSSSIAKALTVLRAFMDGQAHWGVRELATRLDQPLSSTHWLLQILRAEGLVEWSPARQKYLVGPELERWGAALAPLSRRHDLGRQAAEAIGGSYAVYDAPRRRLLVMAGREPGAELPLLDGPAGLAVLALLPASDVPEALREAVARVVAAGHAEAPGQIACAIRDAAGAPVGALLLAAGPERAPALREAAAALSARLGGRILAGVRGTAPYLLGELGKLVQERLPELALDDAGLSNTERLTAIQEGRAGYCAVSLDRIDAAWRGAPPFATPHDRLRLVMPLAPMQLHILVHRDSKLRSLRDLLKARVAAGEADYVTAGIWRELLGLVAPSEAARRRAESRMASRSYDDANRAFAAGELDALVSLNIAPVAGYQDLARTVPLRPIALDGATMQAFIARHPTFAEGAIPAGLYAGSPAVTTLVTALGVATSVARAEAEVFRVAETLDQRLGEAVSWSGGSGVPLHPGAERYWRR